MRAKDIFTADLLVFRKNIHGMSTSFERFAIKIGRFMAKRKKEGKV